MATLNGIDLTLNSRWTNEFEGSAIDREIKYTEDGQQHIFQRKKQTFRKITYDCTLVWLSYDTVKQLADIRDSGMAAVLVHNDGREFSVLLDTIDGIPLKDLNKHSANSRFKVTLHFTEI